MAKHYIWVEVFAPDRSKMKPYVARVGEIVRAHGGRYLTEVGATEVLEGGIGQYADKVVIEFPSKEAALGWYHSPEYQEIAKVRHAASNGNMLVIEGV